MIEITGAGCKHGLLEPLVQHLFAPFVIADTVVRESLHIALDIELPYSSVIPFQVLDNFDGGKHPYRSVRAVSNRSDTAPGLYWGGHDQVVAYDKRAEVLYRWEEELDRSTTLPAHMKDWEDGAGTRLEFRSKDKSDPGRAFDLGNVRKDWLTFALADLSKAIPGTIEAELLRDAKRWGVAHHKPSRKRIKAKRAKFDAVRPTRRKRQPWLELDVVDVWVDRQDRARKAEYVEKNAEVLFKALYDELLRTQHPFDIGQAVEAALTGLETQLQRALTPPPGGKSVLDLGIKVDAVPGIVTWRENTQRKQIDHQYNALDGWF
jgi:hypothetical protein